MAKSLFTYKCPSCRRKVIFIDNEICSNCGHTLSSQERVKLFLRNTAYIILFIVVFAAIVAAAYFFSSNQGDA
jgi:predicted amidophosphoribosyltransferase